MDPIETAVQGVKNGDAKLFEVIIEHFQKQLFHYCYHMLGNIQEAEDAVQESLLKAFNKICSYSVGVSFSAWLYRITYNHCINIIRRRKLLEFIPFTEGDEKEHTVLSTEMAVNEYSSCLTDAMTRISSVDRSVLLLRVLEDKPFDEIGRILGINPANARKKYERAKNKMKSILSVRKGDMENEGFSAG